MSIWKKGTIRIELKSDLAAGSGYSYAGVIDSDICYDDCGIPYIPAKRLRGCLRETLEGSLYALYPDQADRLFGKAGENIAERVVIGNAYIKDYEAIRAMILAKKADKKTAGFYDVQSILGRFTHVLGQTAIRADGTADDNSLRYTRVVNRWSPLSEDSEDRAPLVFDADIQFSGEQDADADRNEEILRAAAAGTRHIGMKRNRGFGNVKCTLEDIGFAAEPDPDSEAPESGDENETVKIRVSVRNVDPLMLSAETEDVSEAFISGQSVLGAVARKYLDGKEHSADSQEFADLFLNGSTKYSNLYPSDGKKVYYPVPVYVNRLKKTKKYVSVLESELPKQEDGSDYDPQNGNQPKKLKGKFAAMAHEGKQVTVSVHEVDKEISYHHSHYKKGADGEEGLLYGQEVIRANQNFEGFILVSAKYAAEVMALLKSGDFYFGKSKSSQYGRCEVHAEYDPGTETAGTVSAGSHLVITFRSDALLLADRGEYTVYKDEIEEIIKNELEIKAAEIKDDKEIKYLSNILTTEATGYLGVWNLRKPAQPAVLAGSCLVYKLAEDFKTDRIFLGERNLEGYGQFRVDCAEDIPYVLTEADKTACCMKKEAEPGSAEVQAEFRNLMKDILVGTWIRQRVFAYLSENRKKRTITNTALGRITLMLKESLQVCGSDYKTALKNLAQRVDSIKSQSFKNEGESALAMVAKRQNEQWVLNFAERFREKAGEDDSVRRELSAIGFTEAEISDMLDAKWGEYLMTVLTEQKYMGGDK